jgi:hypothetical protein
MNNKFLFLMTCFVVQASLAACGPSQAGLDAAATKFVADIFAIQTEMAPTNMIPAIIQ